MRGRSVFFLCALLFSAMLLGAQQTVSPLSTVDDLVRAGIANNKDLAAVRERIAEAKGLTRQAGVRPAPTLGLNGATGKPLGTIGEEQYSAEYSQPVETFGKRRKRIRVAEFSIGIAEADLQQRSTQLAYEITAAYAEVSAERHKLKLLSDLIGPNQDTLRLTEARVKEGDVAPLEASLLKVEISRAEVSRRSAQGRLTSAELELRRLIGLDQAVPIPDPDIPAPAPMDSDTLKRDALANRADLKTARLEEEQEAAGIDLAKAEAKPDVTLSAGYARQDNQFDGLFGFNNSGIVSPLRDRDGANRWRTTAARVLGEKHSTRSGSSLSALARGFRVLADATERSARSLDQQSFGNPRGIQARPIAASRRTQRAAQAGRHRVGLYRCTGRCGPHLGRS